MNDVELDARLRSGLSSIVEAAGDPPPLSAMLHGAPQAGSRSGRLVAAVMATAIATIAGLVLVVAVRRGEDAVVSDQAETEEPAEVDSLFDAWWLTDATVGGMRLEPEVTVRWVFVADQDCATIMCVPGPVVTGEDVCNSFELPARFGDEIITWTGGGITTAASCTSPLQNAFDSVMAAESVDYVIEGDELRLSAGDVKLSFTSQDPAGTAASTG